MASSTDSSLVAQERRALPAPQRRGVVSLEEVLASRRSHRSFVQEPLRIDQISQLAWAAQGITLPEGLRSAPSAGALYPLELYVVSAEGVEHYEPEGHALSRTVAGDVRRSLQRAASSQEAVGEAPVVFVIAGVYRRSATKYGERASRYVPLEAGHVAQNLLLQAQALSLGAVPVGAFDDGAVQRTLRLPSDQEPLYLIPVGRARD
jgi:SagB-type dehydrogenase family enzyme